MLIKSGQSSHMAISAGAMDMGHGPRWVRKYLYIPCTFVRTSEYEYLYPYTHLPTSAILKRFQQLTTILLCLAKLDGKWLVICKVDSRLGLCLGNP